MKPPCKKPPGPRPASPLDLQLHPAPRLSLTPCSCRLSFQPILPSIPSAPLLCPPPHRKDAHLRGPTYPQRLLCGLVSTLFTALGPFPSYSACFVSWPLSWLQRLLGGLAPILVAALALWLGPYPGSALAVWLGLFPVYSAVWLGPVLFSALVVRFGFHASYNACCVARFLYCFPAPLIPTQPPGSPALQPSTPFSHTPTPGSPPNHPHHRSPPPNSQPSSRLSPAPVNFSPAPQPLPPQLPASTLNPVPCQHHSQLPSPQSPHRAASPLTHPERRLRCPLSPFCALDALASNPPLEPSAEGGDDACGAALQCGGGRARAAAATAASFHLHLHLHLYAILQRPLALL